MATQTANTATAERTFDCDLEQDEEFIGPPPSDLSPEQRLVEALVKNALDDCMKVADGRPVSALTKTTALEAWDFIYDTHPDDDQVPWTFDWCCYQLGYSAQTIRRMLWGRCAQPLAIQMGGTHA